MPAMTPTDLAGCISFWDFQEPAGAARTARGLHAAALHERDGGVERVAGGVFGPWAARFADGGRAHLFCPRNRVGALDRHGRGRDAEVTVVAWVRRAAKARRECQAVAGIWGETFGGRQYCLFLDLTIHGSGHQVCGHVSGVGGPSFGQRYCMDAGIGATAVPFAAWHCIAFSYDGARICAHLDGRLDERPGLNPFAYGLGLHDGQPEPSDFTVGAVHRHGEMGNHFVGDLGGLAVYGRCLRADELADLATLTPGPAGSRRDRTTA
jgi:hypothetical protein